MVRGFTAAALGALATIGITAQATRPLQSAVQPPDAFFA